MLHLVSESAQTLSRLNRIHPDKAETVVLDFVNEAEAIAESFQPYFENTMLSEGTDPNLLYDLETRLKEYGIVADDEVEAFAEAFYSEAGQDRLYALLNPAKARWEDLDEHERKESRKALSEYVKTYAFLSQLLTFTDTDLEKLFVFAKYLRRYLPTDPDVLPLDIQEKVDLESYRVSESFRGDIELERGNGEVDPQSKPGPGRPKEEEQEPLSAIITELNERFGAELTEEDKVTIAHLEELLASDETLKASARINPPDKAKTAFDNVFKERLQGIVETNFGLYRRVTDDRAFADVLIGWLYDRSREDLGG